MDFFMASISRESMEEVSSAGSAADLSRRNQTEQERNADSPSRRQPVIIDQRSLPKTPFPTSAGTFPSTRRQ